MNEIRKVAVLGAGTMGNGIAQVFAQAGFQVAMQDLGQEPLSRGFDSIKKSLSRLVRGGKMTEDEANEVVTVRITGTLDLKEAVWDADLVIEAVPEDLEIKRSVFVQLDGICPAHTVLATNTSTISISAIASATKRTDKVVGMHFASPVPLSKGVELITGLDTSEETINIAKQMVRSIGKEYLLAKDCPGFAGNRAFPLFINEAFNTLSEGIATAEDIDKTAKLAFGHPMGPLELADFIGLDQFLNGMEYLHRELGEKYRPSTLLKQLVSCGYYGRKTGRGVYKYQ